MEQVHVIRNLATGQYWNGYKFASDYIYKFIDKIDARAKLSIISPVGNYIAEPIYVN